MGKNVFLIICVLKAALICVINAAIMKNWMARGHEGFNNKGGLSGWEVDNSSESLGFESLWKQWSS